MTVSPLTSPNNFYIYIIMRVKLSKNIDECGFIASVLLYISMRISLPKYIWKNKVPRLAEDFIVNIS